MIKDQIISGRVVTGKKLGRKIGFPTANIHASLPDGIKYGVYLVELAVEGKPYFGVANIGNRPTVNSLNTPIIEIHILDFDQQIYDKEITVRLVEFIRSERKFASVDKLTEAIKEDVKEAHNLINRVK